MAFVAELDRLLARDVSVGVPRRPVELGREPEEAGDNESGAEDADARDRIRAAVKDLGHDPGGA
jgi:hypothetical protein